MKAQLTIISFVLSTALLAQKQKIIAAGSSSDLYYTYKVHSKETYQSIASKNNISGRKLADYNNLEYHDGKLLAKFLKVPLTAQNFIKASDVKNTEGIAAVVKKLGNKSIVIGYFVPDKSKLRSKELPESKDTATIAVPNTPADDTTVKTATPSTAEATAKPAEKKVTEYPKSWIKQKKDYRHKSYGPGKFLKEFYASAILNACITAILIAVIYFYIFSKKKKFLTREQLRKHVVRLISNAILNEQVEDANKVLSFEVPRLLMKRFNEHDVRQLVIDEIVTAKKSLRGKGASNLTALYLYLDLIKDTSQKLSSKKWYIKAKGIQELAVMDQSKYLLTIYRHTNSNNENVRMEAQSAIVHFAGFRGLRFLHFLTYPISDWQQIKLIEQLTMWPDEELPGAHRLLQSQNNSVVIFTLKIISVFHNLALHDAVTLCLKHKDNKVRLQAIKCLTQIYNDDTANILQSVYADEILKNKITILEAMKEIGSKDQTDFLYLEIFSEDDNIKLAAAEALMECCSDAIDLIEAVSSQKGSPYTNILNHVKEGLLL